MTMHHPALDIKLRAVCASVLSLATILPALAAPIADARGNLVRRDKADPTASVSNTGLTHEVVGIWKTTHFPLRVLGCGGGTLVRRIDFSNVSLEH